MARDTAATAGGRKLGARALGLALVFAVGGAGTLVFLRLGLPLPWFLGAMSAVLIASVARAPVERPAFLTLPVRALLGFAIGAAFTPALLGRVPDMLASLLLVVPTVLAMTALGTLYFRRVAGLDQPTAFFAAIPGGVTDVVAMAEQTGADERVVTLAHATRILVIVFLLPFWFQYLWGLEVSGTAGPGVPIASASLADAALIVGLSAAGWALCERLRIAGAALIGPMLVSALVHGAGLTSVKIPSEVMNGAQIVLGVLLGCQFRGVTGRELVGIVSKATVYGLLLVAIALAAAQVSRHLTGAALVSGLLSFTPGGQNELLLLALLLGLDVPFVALHHLMRLAVVILGAQLVISRHPEWRRR